MITRFISTAPGPEILVQTGVPREIWPVLKKGIEEFSGFPCTLCAIGPEEGLPQEWLRIKLHRRNVNLQHGFVEGFFAGAASMVPDVG